MRKIFIILLLVTFFHAPAQKIDSCKYYRMRNDTLSHKLYIAQKQIATTKHYIKIVDKNPSQIKFLKGWINSALSQK